MRVVLDTNVWVSGLLFPNSAAGRIIKEWKNARFQIVISQYILDEISRVLLYPKIQKRLGWDQDKIRHYLDILLFFAEFEDNNDVSAHVEADPNDSPILSTLVNSSSNFLISGDMALLDLKIHYPIVSIAEFLEILDG